MDNNTTVKKEEMTWKIILEGLFDLPTLASRINELAKDCKPLFKQQVIKEFVLLQAPLAFCRKEKKWS